MRRPLNSFIRITTNFGDPVAGSKFGKHLGTDYAVPEGSQVYAPIAGTIIETPVSGLVGKCVILREDGNGRIWRFLHLSKQEVAVGAHVFEGQPIAKSGNTGSSSTGPHLHCDVRKANTLWDASFLNYYNPEILFAVPPTPPPTTGMPPVGSRVQLLPPQMRTTFRAGTTTVAGVIKVTDDSFVYTVRGYDPKYPKRILINSSSAGGNGVALALYYTNGAIIGGWRQV